jgi:hypothetical protein
MPATNELFPIVNPGDPIRAEQWNLITKQVNALSGLGDGANALFTGAGTFIRTPRRLIRERIHFELNEALAASLTWDAAPQEAAADVLERNPNTGALTDTGFGITIANRTDQCP